MTKELLVCVNFRPFSGQPSCALRGSRELADWLEREIECRSLDVSVERIVCFGHCSIGPNVKVKGSDFVHEATREKLTAVLDDLTASSAG